MVDIQAEIFTDGPDSSYLIEHDARCGFALVL